MLTNHDRIKKCEDLDVPRWLLKARESQDADKTLEATDLDTTGNANPPRGVTSQPESLAKDIPPEALRVPVRHQVRPPLRKGVGADPVRLLGPQAPLARKTPGILYLP
jgi:hypothetical protein